MRITLAVAAILILHAAAAQAENRIPAGGAFMNSYSSDPYFDPRSVYSQTHSQGDIGGQIMLAEPPGAPAPCAIFDKPCVDHFERTRAHAYRYMR